MALCITEPELLPIEVLHCMNRDFTKFASRFFFCDLDLDPMTFIYDLDLYSVEMYPQGQYWAGRASNEQQQLPIWPPLISL